MTNSLAISTTVTVFLFFGFIKNDMFIDLGSRIKETGPAGLGLM
jgi:hypothetical protein